MVERYSDSAAAFVLLDSTNMAVYKQLYRAAKAKSKLKLRVTVLEQEPKTVPKPVSVQDVPETPAAAPKPQASAAASQTSLPLRTASTTFSKEYDPFLLNKAAKYVAESEDVRRDFESRLSCLVGRGSSHGANGQRSVQSEVCILIYPTPSRRHGALLTMNNSPRQIASPPCLPLAATAAPAPPPALTITAPHARMATSTFASHALIRASPATATTTG